MKTISRRICGVLLGMGVLGLIVPVVPADDMQDEECRRRAQEERDAADRAYQHAQAEREAADRAYQQTQQEQEARAKAYYEAQQEQEARAKAYQEAQYEQAARDRAYYEAQQERAAQDKAQAERESWDKYNREWQQTQDERAAWYKSNEEARQSAEKERAQKDWDEWHDRLIGRAEWAPEPNSTRPNLQVKVPAGKSGAVVILNPFALAKMTPKNQEKVRRQALHSGLQVIENPFARSAK